MYLGLFLTARFLNGKWNNVDVEKNVNTSVYLYAYYNKLSILEL